MNNQSELVNDKDIDNIRKLNTVHPSVDIYENEEEILLYADMPGVLKGDLAVHIDNGILSLSGVRKLSSQATERWREFEDIEYKRNFSVPQTINVEKVSADLQNGVVKLHLPKSEAAKPKLIEIKAA